MSSVALGVFWGGVWVRGTTSQKCGKNAKRYHFLLWYLWICTVIDLFPNLTTLKGCMGALLLGKHMTGLVQ